MIACFFFWQCCLLGSVCGGCKLLAVGAQKAASSIELVLLDWPVRVVFSHKGIVWKRFDPFVLLKGC